MTQPVRYIVLPVHPEAHLFQVSLEIPDPDPQGETFSLPAWIPGSYMIRDFAKNLVSLSAECAGRAVALTKLDKHTWRSAPLPRKAAGPLRLEAEIYAWDLSVRCAHLDASHGFFNGTQLFLRSHGRETRPHLVELRPPPGCDAWKVFTTLPEARGMKGAARRHGFGLYRAPDYDSLIDHPVEMGTPLLLRFEAGGVPHEMAITGRVRCDLTRLAGDLARICQWHIELFGTPAPFARYLFQTLAVGDGYGGLEHRDSTALLCARRDLPAPGVQGMDEHYRGFLGLCSHEYFHAWNVKRIQPAAFRPYDLARETHTRLLWVFEGFTSYYDDLALVRCGLISADDYLDIVGRNLSAVLRNPGRLKQSVAQSSFDAWTKYYRQDENSPNAIVSYYAKGALVALALDLSLRAASRGKRSLDDVMRYLWAQYGQGGAGLAEDGMAEAIRAATGVDLVRELAAWTEGTADLPLAALLKPVGVELKRESASRLPGLGVRTKGEAGELRFTHVLQGGAGQAAGLSAGDVAVALDGLRLTPASYDSLLARYRPGEQAELLVFRRDELLRLQLRFDPPPDDYKLVWAPKPTAAERTLRRGWLGS